MSTDGPVVIVCASFEGTLVPPGRPRFMPLTISALFLQQENLRTTLDIL